MILYVPHDAAAVSIHRALEEPEAPKLDEFLEAINPDREAPQHTKAAFVAPTEVGVVEEDGPWRRPADLLLRVRGPAERFLYVYVGR